jgi:hypothetical protein
MQEFDFGFTTVTEEELKVVQEAKKTIENASEEIDHEKNKSYNMYNMILPLLNNLARNPEKNYIYWEGPVRVKKIEEFRKQLESVYKS